MSSKKKRFTFFLKGSSLRVLPTSLTLHSFNVTLFVLVSRLFQLELFRDGHMTISGCDVERCPCISVTFLCVHVRKCVDM